MIEFPSVHSVQTEFKYKVKPRQNYIRAPTYEEAYKKIIDNLGFYIDIQIQSIHENTLFTSPESIANPDFE